MRKLNQMPKFKHFSQEGDPNLFFCTHCGKSHVKTAFVRRLDELRDMCEFPFVINSGYRCPEHPSEASKSAPGEHTRGHAADIKVQNGTQRRLLVDCALEMGFNGIGVAKTFVHVDDRDGPPVMWTYG